MRRLLTGLLGATLLLGACGDDDADDTTAVTSIPGDTSTSTSSTTEPSVPPPDVIPSDPSLITGEYVEQVLDALYEVSLEAIELARAEGAVDEPSIVRLESIFTAQEATDAVNGLIRLTAEGFPGYRETLSAATADVTEVLSASEECIFAEVTFDSSGLAEATPTTPNEGRTFVRLKAASEKQRQVANPTAWAIDALPATVDGSVPEEGC